MNTKYSVYQNTLEELLILLQKYNEERWAQYFKESLGLLQKGKPQRSIYHSLNAYGGMGSFNDSVFFTGASEKEAKYGLELKEKLWLECKSKKSILKRAVEL